MTPTPATLKPAILDALRHGVRDGGVDGPDWTRIADDIAQRITNILEPTPVPFHDVEGCGRTEQHVVGQCRATEAEWEAEQTTADILRDFIERADDLGDPELAAWVRPALEEGAA